MDPKDFGLTDAFLRNSRIHLRRVAFALATRCVSQEQFVARVTRLAAALAGFCVSSGDWIAILAQNRFGFVELYGAVAWLA